MRFACLMLVTWAAAPLAVRAQTRALVQDSTLNNLRHSVGTDTAARGTLGRVRKVGEGSRVLLLIPGIGFSDQVWSEFMERQRAKYTMYAVTLPGFGDTAPLALPASSSYAETPWLNSAVSAIEALLRKERIERVIIVAHWALASQIALRLALADPERVAGVVLVGGVLKSYYDSTPAMMNWTLKQRADFADAMGQRWFRTVTRQTWDDNNFMSYDYARHPLRGLFLWREAQAPTLSVWIRYLLEFYSLDPSESLKSLRVPTLVVQPGFDDPDFYVEPGRNYMRNLTQDSWRGAAALTQQLEFVTVPGSRLFIMFDKPAELDQVLERFLQQHKQ